MTWVIGHVSKGNSFSDSSQEIIHCGVQNLESYEGRHGLVGEYTFQYNQGELYNYPSHNMHTQRM